VNLLRTAGTGSKSMVFSKGNLKAAADLTLKTGKESERGQDGFKRHFMVENNAISQNSIPVKFKQPSTGSNKLIPSKNESTEVPKTHFKK